MAALLGRKALEGLARGDGELGHRAGCSHTVIQNCPLAAVWRVSQGQNWRRLWSQEGGAGGWGGGALKGLGLYRMVRKVGFGALEPDCLEANPSFAAY